MNSSPSFTLLNVQITIPLKCWKVFYNQTFTGKIGMSEKLLEPNILFIQERVTIGPEDRCEKITVSELVKKNQPILSWPKSSDSTLKKRTIRTGRNVHFSEDGETVLASTVGYPRIDMIDEPEEDSAILISIVPLVRIADDMMTATLNFHPQTVNGFYPRSETLQELLSEANINFGIDQKALFKALKVLSEDNNDFHEIPIATGQPSVPGTNERLQFAIEIGPIAGKIMEDGSIDFRERKIMLGIKENTLIATRIPAIPGVPGINVCGQEIEPDGGEAIEFKISDDTSFSEETGEIRATQDGILSVINDCQIRVCAKQEIDGDVDYETGNIDSENCIFVKGSVQPGFIVKAVGDIEIRKEVMGATLESDGNIVVKGGITGKRSSITAKGDVDIYFIEQGKINAGGNVIVRKESYYSDISANGDIRYQPGTKLIGGNIVAGGQLSVADAGSINSPSPSLAAGVDIKRLELYNELKKNLEKQQDDIIKWLQLYGGSVKSKKIRGMQAQVDEIKMKLLRLNLIPGSSTFSRLGDMQDTMSPEAETESKKKKAIDISKIHIDIPGTVYAGTKLRIGNYDMTLTKTITNRRIKLKKNLKGVIAVPFKGRV